MTDRKLRADLLKKIDVSPQRLSQMVSDVKRRCPMSTEDATYCIAHRRGLKLDKYLPAETVAHVRSLLPHLVDSVPTGASNVRPPKTVTRTRELRVGGLIEINDPILPEKALNEASEMANKVYPMLYVFENSVREVIQRMLRKKHGPDWWDKASISTDIRGLVAGRQAKEHQEAWHGQRGAHPIYYTDIDHLVRIVQGNWTALKTIFPRQEWFSNLVTCMESSRNPVAHMNPIAKHDIDRVKINLRDWQRLIAAKKAILS